MMIMYISQIYSQSYMRNTMLKSLAIRKGQANKRKKVDKNVYANEFYLLNKSPNIYSFKITANYWLTVVKLG